MNPQGLSRMNLSIKWKELRVPSSLYFLTKKLISTISTTSQDKSIKTMPTPSTSTSGRKSRPLKERQSSRKMTMMKRTRMCKLSNRLRKSRKTNLQLKNLNVRISDYEYHSCFCIFNYNHDIQNYLGTLGGLCSHEGIIIYEASGVRSGIGYMSGWSTCIRIFFIITTIR